MRFKIIILISLLVITTLISGCGKKGDLYKADSSSDKTYEPG
jgi:predicted small lipoprotein YifL